MENKLSRNAVKERRVLTLSNFRTEMTKKSDSTIQSEAATCEQSFVKCFLRVPQEVGLYIAAALLPKQEGSFRKHITKPF